MRDQTSQMVGGIEMGGTKILCAIASSDNIILDQIRIPTGDDPSKAIAAIAGFFGAGQPIGNRIRSIGIGSFGPLSLNRQAADFGSITTTSKPGWSHFPLLRELQAVLSAELSLETDVNCAAIAEILYGAGKDLEQICYVTIGTGIGVGVVINGKPFGGSNHLEAGHMFVRPAPGDEKFEGVCPFHGDCLEGLASGPAMNARWGIAAENLPDGHDGWRIEADYLAQLCINLTYSLRPQRIIMGGGVMERPGFIAEVSQRFMELLGGYDDHAVSLAQHHYICAPDAKTNAGLIGALALAHRHAHGVWPQTGYVAAA